MKKSYRDDLPAEGKTVVIKVQSDLFKTWTWSALFMK